MFERFKTRSYELERLDTGDYTEAEYELWQREMHYIQRFYGEWRALRSCLPEVERGAKILDVGAGSGELLQFTGRELAIEAVLVGVEMEAKAAVEMSRRGLLSVQGDGLNLPFADGAFDYAICSLVLHHLDDRRASQLLSEMKRVSTKRIFVIDLHRTPVSYYFYKIIGRLFLQGLTVEDGSLSILRAFIPAELKSLAESADLEDIRVEHSKAGRLILSGR
jgi:ubiquinone/menaquinone biosynthesis C-methylase UbiE